MFTRWRYTGTKLRGRWGTSNTKTGGKTLGGKIAALVLRCDVLNFAGKHQPIWLVDRQLLRSIAKL